MLHIHSYIGLSVRVKSKRIYFENKTSTSCLSGANPQMHFTCSLRRQQEDKKTSLWLISIPSEVIWGPIVPRSNLRILFSFYLWSYFNRRHFRYRLVSIVARDIFVALGVIYFKRCQVKRRSYRKLLVLYFSVLVRKRGGQKKLA